MRYTLTIYNFLILNPEGMLDKQIIDLAHDCGLTDSEGSFLRNRMVKVGILSHKLLKRKGKKYKVWNLKMPKKAYALAGK